MTVNNSIGTNATADKVWTIFKCGTANFTVGSDLRGDGIPAAFGGSGSTSYTDPGAVQTQAAASSGGGSFAFIG